MNYLAIDTSGAHLSVVVSAGGKLHTHYEENCGVLHSTALMPAVENLLTEAGIKAGDLDFAAAVVGAGSFTGIRIGISTVKALCYALNIPCLKVTSFEVLAYDTTDGNALAVIDAKHGSYYAQKFINFEPVSEAVFVPGEIVKEMADGTFVISSSPVPFGGKICDLCGGLIKAVEAKKGEVTSDLEALTPLYIRKSQAEENR